MCIAEAWRTEELREIPQGGRRRALIATVYMTTCLWFDAPARVCEDMPGSGGKHDMHHLVITGKNSREPSSANTAAPHMAIKAPHKCAGKYCRRRRH
jgi:hypothetical protein